MFRCVEKQDASPADMADWQIANPIYMRDTSSAVLPYYIFTITAGPTYTETPITNAHTITEKLLSLISPADINSFLMNLYTTFLNVHGKRFAKPYTPAQLIKVTKHIMQCVAPSGVADTEEMEWILRVKQIEVKNGAFYLIWSGEGRALQIQLTDESELPPMVSATSGELPPQGSATSGELPPHGSATSGELPPHGSVAVSENEANTPDNCGPLEELNVNELPMSDPSTFRLSPPHDDAASDTRAEERRAVEAARVYAQLAHYKAQKAIAKYVKKYGELDDFLSDSSDDSDSDD